MDGDQLSLTVVRTKVDDVRHSIGSQCVVERHHHTRIAVAGLLHDHPLHVLDQHTRIHNVYNTNTHASKMHPLHAHMHS